MTDFKLDKDASVIAGEATRIHKPHRYPLVVALAVFVLSMLLSYVVIKVVEDNLFTITQEQTIEFSSNYAKVLELNINRSLAGASILGGLIEDRNGDTSGWEVFAQTIYFALGGITNLQLAPDAIVQKIYPMRPGDENAIGHNLIKDDDRRFEADLAIKTKAMVVAGPFDFVQGGRGMVGRYPVFLPVTSPHLKAQNTLSMTYAKQGSQVFWGYATVLIDFDLMISLSGLINLPAQGYDFRLWRLHPDTGEVDVIASSGAQLTNNRVTREIQLPNVIWVLDVEKSGAGGSAYADEVRWGVAVAISLSAALLVFFALLWPSRMSRVVSERTQQLSAAKQHLENISRQYETILDSTAEGIYGISVEGEVLFANPATVAAYGGLSKDLIGKSQYGTLLTVAPDLSIYNRNECSIKQSIYIGAQVHNPNALFTTIDGHHFPVEYTCSPVKDEAHYLAAVIVFRDISERTQLEAELRLNSYAFETNNAILITDARGRILRSNAAFTRMTGYVFSDVKGRNFSIFKLDEDQDITFEEINAEVVEKGSWSGELTSYRKNKFKFTCIMSVNRVLDDVGNISNYVVHIHDITHRKVAEKELEQQKNKAEAANQSKSEFLAMMSHEIRTPLSGVMGILDLLSRTEVNKKQAEYIATAKESGEALLSVINDVLDFSKMEADKLELEESIFEPKALINSVSLLMAPRAQAKGLLFLMETAGSLPEVVKGDPGRLRQILLNLVSNAIKFTTSGSVVLRLTGTNEGKQEVSLVFEVIDSGIGISEENRNHLFEKFSTVDASYSRRFGGTGLGLSISNQLVTLMGGKIGVDSAVDKGSRFWFKVTLPVAKKPKSLPKAEVSAAEHRVSGRILVAEDVVANRLVIKEVLERNGHQVTMVENGLEAVQSVKMDSFDVVLMDISMPEMDGLQATAAIRALPDERSKIPIIAMTAHALKGDRENFLNHKMDDYLTKPIQTDELNAALSKWLTPKTQPSTGAATQKDGAAPDLSQGSQPGSGSVIVDRVLEERSNMIDQAVMAQIAEDTSRELVSTLTAIFIKDARSRLIGLSVAGEKEDWAEVGQHCHSLAGSSMAYGLPGLAKLCRDVEYAVKDNKLDKVVSPFKVLITEAPTHLDALEKFMADWA